MNKEFLYMQKLAGIITESEYAAKIEEKHGIVPNLEEYISLTDPNVDLSDDEFARIDQIEKEALENGTLSDLQKTATIRHWGRYEPQGMDKLKWRQNWIENTKNRITKGGKLNKNSAVWLKNTIKFDKL
jgi:hypothetical protein